MLTEIGFAAGDIWQYLDNQHNYPVTLSTLAAELDRPRDVIVMSIGWLAREGHLILERDGRDYRMRLRRSSQR